MSLSENNETYLEYWEKELSEWKLSGLSIVEYCRRKGISRHRFFYWKRKLSSDSVSANFIEIKGIMPVCVPSVIALKTGRFTVEIKPGFYARDLEKVLRILSGL